MNLTIQNKFKKAAREYIELLDNNEQQDSADFLIQLLELIHNELTGVRVRKTGRFKEKTDKAKAKNNKENIKVNSSIISQNIHGKYSRSMVCEACKFTDSSEDDFTVVSLQIPSCREVTVHIKFYPAEPIDGGIMINYDFKFESDQSLICEVLDKLKLCGNKGVYNEYYKTSEMNEDFELINYSRPIREISEVDDSELQCTVHVYELNSFEGSSWEYFDFKLYFGKEDNELSKRKTSVFKIPIDNDGSFLKFHKCVYKYLMLNTPDCDGESFDKDFEADTQIKNDRCYRIEFDFQNQGINYCPIHKKYEAHVCEVIADDSIDFKEFDFETSTKLLHTDECKENVQIPNIFHNSLIVHQLYRHFDSSQKPCFKIVCFISKRSKLRNLEYNNKTFKKNNIKSTFDCDLISCLKKFTADEIYPDYQCDKCNKESNCIMKTSMSTLPKYLIIQLMRFQSDSSYVRSVLIKNEQFIDFPMNGLDISYIYNGNPSEISCIYDLYGVIYHSGDMSFGHYFTSIRNNVKVDKWYMFSDEQVEPCPEDEIVTENAYVLFYARRENKESNQNEVFSQS